MTRWAKQKFYPGGEIGLSCPYCDRTIERVASDDGSDHWFQHLDGTVDTCTGELPEDTDE
jgi:hypothetical protein